MVTLQELGTDPETTLHAMEGPLVSIDCGIMSYRHALDLQLKLNGLVGASHIPSVCLLMEHYPVITTGIRKDHNLLVSSRDSLESTDIDIVPIRRGGGVTAHNLGQLVIYPIVQLAGLGFRVASFVHYLERVGMDVLSLYGVSSERRNRYPGLWVGNRKIASVGVQIIKGVTLHGIAINLTNDLSIFTHMVPCGIEDVHMTSAVTETGISLSMDEVKAAAELSCTARLPIAKSRGEEPV